MPSLVRQCGGCGGSGAREAQRALGCAAPHTTVELPWYSVVSHCCAHCGAAVAGFSTQITNSVLHGTGLIMSAFGAYPLLRSAQDSGDRWHFWCVPHCPTASLSRCTPPRTHSPTHSTTKRSLVNASFRDTACTPLTRSCPLISACVRAHPVASPHPTPLPPCIAVQCAGVLWTCCVLGEGGL
jgi:hypothetical protein